MRYRAFISYASADRRIGERFQRSIEHFRLPRALRGVEHGFGPIPKRLTPLFRDRSDARAGADLSEVFRAALENSEALIVLCSPAAARSPWVDVEIRTFKALGRSQRIFPVLVDGVPLRYDPADSPDGAFPPALFQRFGTDGALIAEDAPAPLAADLRASGDGEYMAKLKVAAALTGAPLTVLTRRQQEAERRERRVVRAVAVAMTVLALLAGAAAVQAWRSEINAQARLEAAIEMAARRVDDAAQFQDAFGVPSAVIRQLLEGAQRDFDTLVRAPGSRAPTLELQRARLLVLFSGLYGAIGDGARQLELAQAGVAAVDGVTTVRSPRRPATWFSSLPAPGDVTRERLGALEALGVALANAGGVEEAAEIFAQGRALAESFGDRLRTARFWALLGEHRYLTEDLEGALAAYEAAVAALDGVTEEGEGRAMARRERAFAQSDRAQMLLELGRPDEALAAQASSTDFFAAEAERGADAAALQALAHALGRQGALLYAVHRSWEPSFPVFARAVELLTTIQAADPTRVDYARDLSIALDALGDAHLQSGDAGMAHPLFDRSLALRRELLARNPHSRDAGRDVAVALERQADAALMQQRPRDALAALDEARALREGSDPLSEDAPVFTRDMAVLWYKTGRVRAALGGTEDWRQAYASAIALMEPLLAMAPAPPGWLRDLAIFHTAYADASWRAGAPVEAVDHWTAALDLIERQRARTPDDTQLHDDAALLRARIDGRNLP